MTITLGPHHPVFEARLATRLCESEMSRPDDDAEVYEPARADRLRALLRFLAKRIQELDASGDMLAAAAELQQLLGDARSELFHYEVRSTYDTPEIAESRRIVRDAAESTFTTDDPEDDEPWRTPRQPD